MKVIVFPDDFGPLFDTSLNTLFLRLLEDELEGGRRTSLDKMDRYFYATIWVCA